MRFKIIRLVIYIFFVIIAVELFYVQVIRGRHYHRLSTNNRIRVVPLEGWRGRILDRNGVVLADNRRSFDVLITPQEIQDWEALVKYLSNVLNIESKELIKKYQQRKSAAFAPVVIAEDIPREKAIIIEENKFRFPSLFIQEHYQRVYPLGRNSAHVVGYVGKISRSKIEQFKEYGLSAQSTVGYLGVEEYYDAFLKGEPGGVQIEVNSRGQQVRLLSLREPTKGQDIAVTIDTRIQEVIQGVLQGRTGAIVIMDMDNGEILGMTSMPDFDPNHFVDQDYRKQLNQLMRDSRSPMVNRAVKSAYPPGSVFKIPVAIAALDKKKITQYTTFDCPGFMEIGGIRFGDTCTMGSQNLIEAITHSCNVYFYHLGLMLGPEMLAYYAELFGLGKPTHIDLPYEELGHIPTPRMKILKHRERWYKGDTVNTSIGQGYVLTTPLQLVRMVATVARNGYEVQPHVIQSINGQAVDKYAFQKQIYISDQIFDTVKKGLRASVSEFSGTAHTLDINGLFVAGKTGTAQTVKGKEHHAWFAGYAQGKNRNIAFCIFLEHGGSSHNATLVGNEMLLQMQQEQLL